MLLMAIEQKNPFRNNQSMNDRIFVQCSVNNIHILTRLISFGYNLTTSLSISQYLITSIQQYIFVLFLFPWFSRFFPFLFVALLRMFVIANWIALTIRLLLFWTEKTVIDVTIFQFWLNITNTNILNWFVVLIPFYKKNQN